MTIFKCVCVCVQWRFNSTDALDGISKALPICFPNHLGEKKERKTRETINNIYLRQSYTFYFLADRG